MLCYFILDFQAGKYLIIKNNPRINLLLLLLLLLLKFNNNSNNNLVIMFKVLTIWELI